MTLQPPYQDVYLYQEVGANLAGLTCPHVANSSNVTLQELSGAESTTCTHHGSNVTISFVRMEEAEPVTNSTNAKYYLLPWDTELPPDRAGSSDVEVLCWSGTEWDTRNGWISEDKKTICCNNRASSDSCSSVIFMDKSRVLEEREENIEVGYGFQMNYSTTIWPYDELKTELTCGNYNCTFRGTLPTSGSCADLRYDPISPERNNLPFHEVFAPLKRSRQTLSYDLNISVPYLTKDFDGAEECKVRLLLGELDHEVVRSVLKLILNVSPPIVSADSDIGFLLVDDFRDKDPKCIGDGWPISDSKWMIKKAQDKFKDLPKFRSKVAGKMYACIASRDNYNETKHMMFVRAPESKDLCSHNSRFLDVGIAMSLTCKTRLTDWEPKPTRVGWTFPNGTEREIKGETERWSFQATEKGIYKCWAQIDEDFSEHPQEEPFRLSKDIEVTLRSSSSSECKYH